MINSTFPDCSDIYSISDLIHLTSDILTNDSSLLLLYLLFCFFANITQTFLKNPFQGGDFFYFNFAFLASVLT